MGILSWIVVGFIAGGLARRVTGGHKRGCLGTILIGIVGGLVGGWLFTLAGDDGINDFGLRSIFVAFIGAAVLILVSQAIGVTKRK